MSNNSSITLFHLNIGTKILLIGFLRAFSVSRFNRSPRINQKSADGKTFSRLQKRPHLSSSAHSSGNQNILGCFSEVLSSATVALFSIPFLAASWEKLWESTTKNIPTFHWVSSVTEKSPDLRAWRRSASTKPRSNAENKFKKCVPSI